MVKEEKKGGGAVKAGTNWKPAVVPTLALIVVGIVPGLLKGLYEPYAGTLISACHLSVLCSAALRLWPSAICLTRR
jgi:hypothetical protein